MKHFRVTTIVALGMLLTVGCTSRETSGPKESSEVADHSATPKTVEAPNPAIQQKRIEYRDAMRELVEVCRRKYLDGSGSIEQLIASEVALSDAELAISSTKEERLAILKGSLEKLKELEQYQQERLKVGAGRRDEMVKAKAGRIRGELLLLEERERED